MNRMLILSLLALLLVASCAAPSEAEAEGALERAWAKDWMKMGHSVGLLSEAEAAPGAARGAGSSARAAIGAAQAYGGDIAGGVARAVIDGGAGLAADFGLQGADKFRLNVASDWDVTNLTIVDRRRSQEDYVVRVRYDVYAIVGGERQRIGADLTQSVRLMSSEGDWEAVVIG